MIERLLRHIFDLLILLVVVSFVLGLALGLLHQGGAAIGATAGRIVPRLIADIVVTLLIGIFCAGLAVRVQRAVTGHGGRTGRERAAQERQVRLAVRRPAADVPVIPAEHGPPPDPDPALDLGEAR